MHGGKHSALDLVVVVLLILGAINWGLVGLMNMDLVANLLGAGSMLAKVVYSVIALAGLYAITWLFKK